MMQLQLFWIPNIHSKYFNSPNLINHYALIAGPSLIEEHHLAETYHFFIGIYAFSINIFKVDAF